MTKRACAWCGADISGRGPKALFCNHVCKKRRYRLQARHTATKKCKMCGATFDASGKSHRRIVCSDQCWRDWDALKHAIKSRTPKVIFGPHRPMACKTCGKKHINFNGRHGYCSRPCKAKAYAKSDAGIAYRQAFANSGYFREYARRRAADAAISLLIMPVQKEKNMSESKREWPEQKQPPIEHPERDQ